jgi:hypothetical protein
MRLKRFLSLTVVDSDVPRAVDRGSDGEKQRFIRGFTANASALKKQRSESGWGQGWR